MESSRRLGNEPECRCKPTLHIWQTKAAEEAEEEQKWHHHHHHLHANPKKGVNPNPRISQMARNHAVSCNCRRLQLCNVRGKCKKMRENGRKIDATSSSTDDAEELQSMQRVNLDTRV